MFIVWLFCFEFYNHHIHKRKQQTENIGIEEKVMIRIELNSRSISQIFKRFFVIASVNWEFPYQ